jgi:hypothetical protein
MLRAVFIAGVIFAAGACGENEAEKASSTTAADAGRSQSLKLWMSANANPAVKYQNFEKLGYVFKTVPSFSPNDPQFSTWASIAESGAAAAAKRDIEGVRQACQSCHSAHRRPYRNWANGR